MHRPTSLIALAAAGCALALAACGGSGSPVAGAGTTATANASRFALSKCMRSHGVSNFPDPTAGPGGEGFNGLGETDTRVLIVDPDFSGGRAAIRIVVGSGSGSGSESGSGINPASPAFQHARTACGRP